MPRKRYYDSEHDEAYYHIIFRAAADHCDGRHFQITDEMKTYLVNLLRRYDAYYQIDVLAYCWMSTHGHLVIRRRKNAGQEIGLVEVAERYQTFHNHEERIDARSVKCRRIKKRLNSISDFMGRFLRESSITWNLAHNKWSGHFWRERFKSILLEDGEALSTCLKYVELNPVRAKMVKDPADYQWSSWGERAVISNKGKGKRDGSSPSAVEGKTVTMDNERENWENHHPYRERIIASLRHIYDISVEQMSDEKVWAIYARDLIILSELSNGTETEIIDTLSEEVYKSLLLSNPRLTRTTRLSLGRSRRETS